MNATETAYVEGFEDKNKALSDQNDSFVNEVKYLNEQLELLKRHIFGQRSEKYVEHLDANQLYLDGFEPTDISTERGEKETESEVKKKKKKKRHGLDKVTLPKDLPVEEVFIDVSPEEKVCPETGKPLVKIGEEVTHKLAYRPGSYYIKQITRPKYGLPQGEGVVCAPLPDSILTRCLADESLLAHIVVQKFADHLPLYRICEGLARQGIGISRQLLSQWVLALGKALEPLHQEMYRRILASGNVFIDESHVDLQAPRKVHKAWMWVLVGGDRSRSPLPDLQLSVHP